MKNKLFILILIVCNLLTAYVSGEVPPAKVVFQQYMNQAQTFANNFPREKAYLHFDNTSYYVGDTIWFKAYVIMLFLYGYHKWLHLFIYRDFVKVIKIIRHLFNRCNKTSRQKMIRYNANNHNKETNNGFLRNSFIIE